MFNNNKDNETDFCESYKSEILGTSKMKEETSFLGTVAKLFTILVLLTVIIGISFYGYNYFTNMEKQSGMVLPPVSVQISDEDLVVEVEEPTTEVKEEKNLTVSTKPVSKLLTEDEENREMERVAKEMKIAIAQSEMQEENNSQEKTSKTSSSEQKVVEENDTQNLTIEVESLEVPTAASGAAYLEDLAKLSEEIDKDSK